MSSISLKERGGGKIVPDTGNGSKNKKEMVNKKRTAQTQQDSVTDMLTPNDPGWYKQLNRQWYNLETKKSIKALR